MRQQPACRWPGLAVVACSAISSSSKPEGIKEQRCKDKYHAKPNDDTHHQIPQNVTKGDAAVFSSGGESPQAAPGEREIQDDERGQEIRDLQKRASVCISDFEAEIHPEAKADASDRITCGDFFMRDGAIHGFFCAELFKPNV